MDYKKAFDELTARILGDQYRWKDTNAREDATIAIFETVEKFGNPAEFMNFVKEAVDAAISESSDPIIKLGTEVLMKKIIQEVSEKPEKPEEPEETEVSPGGEAGEYAVG